MRTALITGVAGQDGVYLARSLVRSGHRVVGLAAPGFTSDDPRSVYLGDVDVRPVDVRDGAAVRAVVHDVRPELVFNLAAQSSVGRSWADPEATMATNLGPVAHLVGALLELRDGGASPRLFQASSAEVGGDAADSPYARSKAGADELVRAAREEQGLFAVCGFLSSHESPLRGEQFVTRRITVGVAELALGRREVLTLGNLDVHRDWGFAGDYVEAMRLMVEADEPRDLAIGTGVAHSLADLLALAFDAAGLGEPDDRVQQDPDLLRPSDSAVLVTDPEPAAAAIGWRARVPFADVVRQMVAVDLERLRTGVVEDERYLGLALPVR